MSWHFIHSWGLWADLERASYGYWSVEEQKNVMVREVLIQVRQCSECGKKQTREVRI